MKFRVTFRSNDGAKATRIVSAESRFEIYEQAKKEGATVVNVRENNSLSDKLKSLNISFGSGVKQTQVMQLVKNLSAMLKAGLSLSRAMSVVERQSRGALKEISHDLSARITAGASFHEALGAHPDVFSPLLIAMARSGEESGTLSESLANVGYQMERTQELIRKVRGAMIYPVVILVAIVIVAVLMLIYVVPTLTQTFDELGVEVPTATKVITAISDFMAANSILVLILMGIFFLGAYLFARSKAGSSLILAAALKLPVIGELVRETYAARAARTLASLMTSGVPLVSGLAIAEQVVGAPPFAKVIADAREGVRKGEALSAAFAANPKLYPILMSDMLAVGEETGNTAQMLEQVATFYETDVEQRTKDLSTIIEPVLMLVIGAAVGVFAVAMIAPIYSISDAI